MFEIFTVPVENTNKYLIYSPLKMLAFIGNYQMAERVKELSTVTGAAESPLSNELVSFLNDIGLLQPDPNPANFENLNNHLTLLVTNQCQLRCVYCYASAGEFTPKTLKLCTAKTAIDHVLELSDERQPLGLNFHGGGEPTFAWDFIRQVVEYVREKSHHFDTSITSNAMWSESQCRWLAENIDSISISMDGYEKVQNRNRPTSTSLPSFPVVFRNLNLLDSLGVNYSIRITSVQPFSDLVDNIKFITENTSCKAIRVEPTFDYVRGSRAFDLPLDECREFISAFKAAYLVAKKAKAELGYSGVRVGVVAPHFCSAPYDGLIVTPDDQIVACFEVTNSTHPLSSIATVGEVRDGAVHVYEDRRARLHQLLKERYDSCIGCFCQRTCAGDCFARSFQHVENGHVIFNNRCDINRELTKFVLMDHISDSQGVWSKAWNCHKSC